MTSKQGGGGAVVVAAGNGSRMGAGQKKQYRVVAGEPLLVHTLRPFLVCSFEAIVVVVGQGEVDEVEQLLRTHAIFCATGSQMYVVAGGSQRQHSVYAGVSTLFERCSHASWVLVHDGARPFISSALIQRSIQGYADFCAQLPFTHPHQRAGGIVLAVPVTDTIKQTAGEHRHVACTLPRTQLWTVQTPQVFDVSLLLYAHRQAQVENFIGTDDAALVERLGNPVHVVLGEEWNSKVTTEADWETVIARLGQGPKKSYDNTPQGDDAMRVGYGYDVHRFVAGRPCILGGVHIPCDRGLLGHSDADVLLHAIADAVLGALGCGDIGQHFPDTEAQWAGVSSVLLLERVWTMATERGYRLGNVDCTVIAERPKLALHVPLMKQMIASVLGSPAGRVNIKATTSEKLGFVGREEGIAAHAIVCLVAQS